MSHFHSVYDTDAHFSINPISRTLTNESSLKTKLVQYDHNSERFTFEVPRYIEGHDMSLCNVVQIHYINIEAGNDTAAEDDTETGNETRTLNTKRGLYEVDDVQLSPEDEDMVIFSWLIRRNATQFVGSLNFAVRFCCIPEDSDEVEYEWNTEPYVGIIVTDGIYNGDAIVEEYADVLEQWRKDLFSGSAGGTVVQADMATNDATDPAYVKNRTHYKELAMIMSETTLTLDDEGIAYITEPIGTILSGETYNVTWNGVEYSCVAVDNTDDGIVIVGLGNIGLVDGGEDTGEPFACITVQGGMDGIYAMIVPLDGSTAPVMSISGAVFHKLDKNYLPSEALVEGDTRLVGQRNTETLAETFNDVAYNTASGKASHSEGSGTTASGEYAHAEGGNTTASGNQAHSEGKGTTASSLGSHAEGNSTIASGYASHSEGNSTIASGSYSHSEGSSTSAKASRSHAEGQGTIAAGENQHVQGKYNLEDSSGKYAHIVGNGSTAGYRSNAHTLDWDGNAWFAGGIELTSPNGTRYRITVADDGTLSAVQVTA